MNAGWRKQGGYDADARRDFGTRGEWDCGTRPIAYVWCNAQRHYHYSDVRANTRIPTHGRVRLQWRMNASQRGTRKDVRVGTYAASNNPRVRALAS